MPRIFAASLRLALWASTSMICCLFSWLSDESPPLTATSASCFQPRPIIGSTASTSVTLIVSFSQSTASCSLMLRISRMLPGHA